MSKTVDPKKTYVGVVENNDDPKKIGRCQIRVMDVFDNLKIEDLPWASPWKDLNGNQFNVPDKGKVVTVVFENGNTNNPEYISSDHYNVNLEQKLQQLSKDDYLSMKSLLYDHKTQIYVNDSEGLKIDHKFNNINIKEQSINVNLKDNFGKVNLGSQNSTQRAILGDNFTNWFDTFLNILMGAQGGSFLGNLAAPVVATPALMSHIQLYFQLKDPKLLSKNVYIVDNDSVTKQERTDKVTEGQKGDTWASTVDENKLTTKEDIKFTPTDGSSSTTFDKPPVNAEKPLSSIDLAPKKPDSHPDVDVLLELLQMKNYKIYDKPYELNIVSIRNQCLSEGDKYTDEFVDKLYVLYKDDKSNWQVKQYIFSTVPGAEFTISDSWLKQSEIKDLSYWSTKIGQKVTMKEYIKGTIDNSKKALKILVPSQYIDVYVLSKWGGESALLTTKDSKQMVWYDNDFDRPDFVPNNLTTPSISNDDGSGDFGINIHLGYPGGKKVGNWSVDGSQCFATSDELKDFFTLCEKHSSLNGNKFSYTLATKDDWEQSTKNTQANKLVSKININPTTNLVTPFSIDSKTVETSLTKPDSPLIIPNETKSILKNEKTTGSTQSSPTDTTKANIVKPEFFKSILDVISFQIWSNKNKVSLDTDGIWGVKTNDAWISLKKTYLKSLNGITDSDLRLVHSRLSPYGESTPLNKSFIYQASFSKTKLSDKIDYSLDYTINFYDNGRFTIYDNKRQVNIVKGSYSNGGRTILPSEGINSGKVFKDDNAWNAIRKAIS